MLHTGIQWEYLHNRLHLTKAVSLRRGLTAADFGAYGPLLLRSLNNLVLVLLAGEAARPGELLDATGTRVHWLSGCRRATWAPGTTSH